MSAQVLSGKVVAQAIKDQCKADAEALRAKGIVPKLGIVRVGAKDNDLSYERGAKKTLEAAGVDVEVFEMPADVTQEDFDKTLTKVNDDPSINGILMFLPLRFGFRLIIFDGNVTRIRKILHGFTEGVGI